MRRPYLWLDIKSSGGSEQSHIAVEPEQVVQPNILSSADHTHRDISEPPVWQIHIFIILRSNMQLSREILCIAVALICFIGVSSALPADKERFLNELDLVDDDGSMETALINYLFTKQMVKRLRSQMDIGDLQRKRTYWKQCAFNAVSCFGK